VLRYALDTNTVSYYLRREGAVADRLLATSPTQIVLPAVVVYELSFGMRRRGWRAGLDALSALVRQVETIAFDLEAADHAARIRLELESAGLPISTADLLIAATARRHGCTLVTHNTREFARVPGLLVEDWY
jgi:tRNA(fMet)-specific endonuclease VapC